MRMRSTVMAALLSAMVAVAGAAQIDYSALWDGAMPFDRFLDSVRVREAQWKSRFANAAVDADALTRIRALKEKRRILAVAEDRCSDSAWALPYVAKLSAAVPERLELRVIGRKEGGSVQSANLTSDGRVATPTIVILDENNRPVGGWVERPSELQAWVIRNTVSLSSDELHDRMDKWYTGDAGKSTLREIVALLEKSAGGGG